MDIVNKKIRKKMMSKIRNKGTELELKVRKILFSSGFRYRLNVNNLPGKPDIVLKKYKTVIFINGCFWHQHNNCKKATIPKTNTLFWKKKLDNNKSRDEKNCKDLKKSGWKVITIWECEIKNKITFPHTMKNITERIKNE